MIGITNLDVFMQFDREEIPVGSLLAEDRKIYFRYEASFVDKGLQISPVKLPLSLGIHAADAVPFDGLFGVFDDSLPDGWGRLLLDRTLTRRGVAIEQIGVLDRLAYVGAEGMGALIYRPSIEKEVHNDFPIQLDTIAHEMHHFLEGLSTEILEELFTLGGSSGGARPKIMVGYNPHTDHLIHGLSDLPDGYEHWLIKFPASADRIDSANIEYAYYKMARAAGIEMSESRLFTGASGKQYFGTKRFDRAANTRVHMHSACGLLHDNFRQSTIDYGHILFRAHQLEQHVQAYEKVLRLAAFNVYSHNRDDHSKNFSFLMNEKGQWRFAPAYDLTFSNSSHGYHSTTVDGESYKPGKKQLLSLADNFSMKHPEAILQQVRNALSDWKQFAVDAGVGKESMEVIQRAMDRMKD